MKERLDWNNYGDFCFFFFSSRRRHTRCLSDWSSDVCSSDLSLPRRCQRPRQVRYLAHFVLDSYARVKREADIVLVEGAGSASEVNLRGHDIANMGFARAADVPVILIGDIDRGGVIASLVGTKTVLDPSDAAQIRGSLVNKFRGDPQLFADGVATIERVTGWEALGVVPFFPVARLLP